MQTALSARRISRPCVRDERSSLRKNGGSGLRVLVVDVHLARRCGTPARRPSFAPHPAPAVATDCGPRTLLGLGAVRRRRFRCRVEGRRRFQWPPLDKCGEYGRAPAGEVDEPGPRTRRPADFRTGNTVVSCRSHRPNLLGRLVSRRVNEAVALTWADEVCSQVAGKTV